jgi:hypothetical protein
VSATCKVSECKQQIVAKGFCDKHYRRHKKHGNTDEIHVIEKSCEKCGKNFPTKSIGGKKLYCSELCKKLAYADSLLGCKIPNCGKKRTTQKSELCSMHKQRLQKYGDPLFVKKLARYENSAICTIDGCGKKPLAREMCNQHYTMWKKHGNPLAGAYRMPHKRAIIHEDGSRTCTKCQQRLSLSKFHKDKSATGGYRATCKKCRINHVKKWYGKNKERQSEREKQRRLKNHEKYTEKEKIRYAKDRDKRILLATEHAHLRKARKKKTVTERGISKLSLRKKLGSKCYYCGKEMDFSTAKGKKWTRDMATIEHLIPLAKGGQHTFANTVLACRFCNISKNAKSEKEFRQEMKGKK